MSHVSHFKYNITCLLVFLPYLVFCQQIQWAHKVIKSSSNLGGKQYSIQRVLGRPDAFPQGGDSPNAWAPKKAQDGYEFIELAFQQPQTVKQIAIFENLNAGCVKKILVGTGDGKYKEVHKIRAEVKDWKNLKNEFTRQYYYNRKRRKVEQAPLVNNNPGIEYVILENPETHVSALKIIFDFNRTQGQKQIDAIGISDSEIPILPLINNLQGSDMISAPEIIYSSDDYVAASGVLENRLYFSKYDEQTCKIYTLERDGENWKNPHLVPAPLNGSYNYVASVCPGKNLIIVGGFPYQKGTLQTGFYSYSIKEQRVEPKEEIKITAFSNYENTADLSITDDGKTLFMAIESDITSGGTDLYFSNLKEDGTYGYLQNLGKNVNSAANEGIPFYTDKPGVLFYESTGFSGYGDADIYFIKKQDDAYKSWSDPVNLGVVINTNSYEGAPMYDARKEEFYFTRYQDGKYHIMRVKMPLSTFK